MKGTDDEADHPQAAPSPLHLIQPPNRPFAATANTHDTLQLLGNGNNLARLARVPEVDSGQIQASTHRPQHPARPTPPPSKNREENTGSPTPDRTPRQRSRGATVVSPPETASQYSGRAASQPSSTPKSVHSVRVGSNQPWTTLTTTPPALSEAALLKAIASTLNTQKREIFELKGDITRNDNGHVASFDRIEKQVEDVHKDVKFLMQEIAALREALAKASSVPLNTPPYTNSSAASNHTSDSRRSPRRSKDSGPPTSFPASLTTIPDTSPVVAKRVPSSPTSANSTRNHEHQPSGSSTGTTSRTATTYTSPRRKASKHRRGRSNTSNTSTAILRTPPRTGSSNRSSVVYTTPQTKRTASNASSVRSAIRHIERKASDSSTTRVATADEVFSRTPKARVQSDERVSRSHSPVKLGESIAKRGMAAMKRALSPTRPQLDRAATTPAEKMTGAANAHITRSVPVRTDSLQHVGAHRDAHGLGTHSIGVEDLADFGVSPTPVAYGRRQYASESDGARRVLMGQERERGLRGTR